MTVWASPYQRHHFGDGDYPAMGLIGTGVLAQG